MTALEAVGLSRRYGSITALVAVDLCVPAGSVFGLVGPNGSGKTTLLEIVAGIRRPSAGRVTVCGEVAYCPDVAEFDPWLAAHEVLEVAAALLGRHVAPPAARAALERVGLADAADRRVGGFSRGMTTRLNIAAALIADPVLILLDEPAAALDPAGRAELLELTASLAPAATVILSSHDLADIEAVCDHVAILATGRLIYSGPIDTLLAQTAAPRWRLQLREPTAPTLAVLRRTSWASSIEELDGGRIEFTSSQPALVEAELPSLLASTHARVVSLCPQRSTLEQVFLALTTDTAILRAVR